MKLAHAAEVEKILADKQVIIDGHEAVIDKLMKKIASLKN
jgi:hypothetical protein